MNAKKEILEHIGDRSVIYLTISLYNLETNDHELIGEGVLSEVLPKLNFTYDASFGVQYLFGTIWYSGGTWSEREEYDGSEWWIHKVRPALPTSARNLL
jgi:hypothetical protein